MYPANRYFFITRIFYISFLLVIYNTILKRYDESNSLLRLKPPNSDFEGKLSSFLENFFSYDSVHFIHLAENGYTTLKNFAFLPVFPYSVRYLSFIVKPILNLFCPSFANESLYLVLTGFILSNFLCLVNGHLIYKLAKKIGKSDSSAQIITLLFYINPGTIFFISVYTENMYLFMHLVIIHLVFSFSENQSTWKIIAFIPLFIIAMLVRSNALFTGVYLFIPLYYKVLSSSPSSKDSFLSRLFYLIKLLLRNPLLILSLFVVFFMYLFISRWFPQLYVCLTSNEEHCNEILMIKNVYSLIQTKYWDVGLFHQFHPKYYDRMLLAAPLFYISYNMLKKIMKKYSLVSLFNLKILDVIKKENSNLKDIILFPIYLNHVANWVVILLFAHQQIVNRILSCNPILFIYCESEIRKWIKNKDRKVGGAALVIFLSLSMAGSFLYPGSYFFA